MTLTTVTTAWLIRLIRILIVLIPAATAFSVLARFPYPRSTLVAYPLMLAGRGPGGSWRQAREAYYARLLQEEVVEQIRRRSQIVEHADNNLHRYRTPLGFYWIPYGMNLPSLLSEMQVKYRPTGGQWVRPGDVVLDCGANVGVFTRAALSAGAGKVVAIEPSPRNIACLRRTFSVEIAEGRVVLYPGGVWDREDILPLNESITSAEDSLVMQRKEFRSSVRVPLTTIDRLAAELNLGRVDFIKMDIEGAERKALAGASHTIERFHPRLEVSVNHLPDDPQVLPRIIGKAWSGYRIKCIMCSFDAQRWRLVADILYFE